MPREKVSERQRIPYRPTPERRKLLKILAAERETTTQAIIDRALDIYLKDIEERPPEPSEPERRAVERFLECYRTTSPERRDLLLGLIEEFRGRQP